VLLACQQLLVVDVPTQDVLLLAGHLLQKQVFIILVDCCKELAGVVRVVWNQ
jgi:hypothetical protein